MFIANRDVRNISATIPIDFKIKSQFFPTLFTTKTSMNMNTVKPEAGNYVDFFLLLNSS